MLEGGWLQVIQRIPPDYYDALSVISITGAELVVQQIFRVERDFLVVRARTSGTLDGGRTVVVPYSQIDFLAFNRKMSEEEVNTIFAAPFQPVSPVYATAPASDLPPVPVLPHLPLPVTTPAAAPAAATPEPETPAEPAGPKPGQISKTILLARLRERLAEKAK